MESTLAIEYTIFNIILFIIKNQLKTEEGSPLWSKEEEYVEPLLLASLRWMERFNFACKFSIIFLFY